MVQHGMVRKPAGLGCLGGAAALTRSEGGTSAPCRKTGDPRYTLGYAQVVTNHRAADSSQLDLELGEIVCVLERDESGWWGGTKAGGGARGWFPRAKVRALATPTPPAGRSFSTPQRDLPSTTATSAASTAPSSAGASVVLAAHPSSKPTTPPSKLTVDEELSALRTEVTSLRAIAERAEPTIEELRQRCAKLEAELESEKARCDLAQRTVQMVQEEKLELKARLQELEQQASLAARLANSPCRGSSALSRGAAGSEPRQASRHPPLGTTPRRSPSKERLGALGSVPDQRPPRRQLLRARSDQCFPRARNLGPALSHHGAAERRKSPSESPRASGSSCNGEVEPPKHMTTPVKAACGTPHKLGAPATPNSRRRGGAGDGHPVGRSASPTSSPARTLAFTSHSKSWSDLAPVRSTSALLPGSSGRSPHLSPLRSAVVAGDAPSPTVDSAAGAAPELPSNICGTGLATASCHRELVKAYSMHDLLPPSTPLESLSEAGEFAATATAAGSQSESVAEWPVKAESEESDSSSAVVLGLSPMTRTTFEDPTVHGFQTDA